MLLHLNELNSVFFVTAFLKKRLFFLRPLQLLTSNYISFMAFENRNNRVNGYGRITNALVILRHFIFYSYQFIFTFRLILCLTALNFPLYETYFKYDIFLDYLVSIGFFDSHLTLVLIPAPLLMAYYDYLGSFAKGLRVYILAYDLMLLNRSHFLRLNKKLTWSTLWNAVVRKDTYTLEEIRLRWHQLPHANHLDYLIRVRAVVYAYFVDLLFALYVTISALVCLYFLSSYNAFFALSVSADLLISKTRLFLFFFDCCLFLYSFWSCSCTVFLLILILHMLIIVFVGQQREMNRRLGLIMLMLGVSDVLGKKKRINKKNEVIMKAAASKSLAFHLPFYLRFHFRMLREFFTANQEIVSTFLLRTLFCIFSLNIYIITALMLKSMSLQNRIVLLDVVSLQTIFLCLATQPMIVAFRSLRSPARYLYQAQLRLNRLPQITTLKIKLATYYEVLTSGEPFAFSVGPLGKVTSQNVLQVKLKYKF